MSDFDPATPRPRPARKPRSPETEAAEGLKAKGTPDTPVMGGTDALDWLLKYEASLRLDYWLNKPSWIVVVHTGHGQIARGDTPHEAMQKAMEKWGSP